MPGNWDGKSRPSSKKYRDNYDTIFKKKKQEDKKEEVKKNKKQKDV